MEYGIWNMEYGIWNMEYGNLKNVTRLKPIVTNHFLLITSPLSPLIMPLSLAKDQYHILLPVHQRISGML